MILDFDSYIINESSLKKLKKTLHGVLNMSDRKRMRKELRSNIITFKFRKRNGDLRTAHGTLHPDYLPKLKGGPKPPEHQMVYYDLDKEGWRSFRSYSFIKILNIKPVGSSVTAGPTVKPKPAPVKTTSFAKGSSNDDEEIKKNSEAESEEQEEKEVKKVSKKHGHDEDEEEHEYKSPIYDESKGEKEEREEDDEKVKEIEHKHKKKKEIIHKEEPEEEPEEKPEEESEEKDKKDKKKDEEE